MNRRLVFLSAFAAVLMVSVLAYGQRQGQGQRGGRGMTGRGGMMGRSMSAAGLLRSEPVQKEIGITEEQKTKLSELSTGNRQGFGNIRDMSQEEREKAMAEFRKAAAEMEKKVTAILDKKQAKRLEEIRIQAMGFAAVSDEKVAKKLGITDEQKEKMTAARNAMMQKVRDAMSGGDRPDREALAKMREEYEGAAKKLLTEKQTAQFEKMKGKPFDMAQLRGGRSGGRRGN